MAQNAVLGIGRVPDQALRIVSDGINYEKRPDTNHHNEDAIVVYPNRGDLFNDDTVLDFACTEKQCELDIAVNSEVGTALYNDGLFQLTYDRASQTWDMKAYRLAGPFWNKERVEWKFCSPDAALGHVHSILTYLAADTEKEVSLDGRKTAFAGLDVDRLLQGLSFSIGNSYQHTVLQSSKFTDREDCRALPFAVQGGIDDKNSTPYSYMPPDF